MEKKFILIQYKIEDSDSNANIKEMIKTLGDWFNYFQGSFLVFTTQTPDTIYNLIKTEKLGDNILILELDLKAFYGWMPKKAWDWLNDKKTKQKRTK